MLAALLLLFSFPSAKKSVVIDQIDESALTEESNQQDTLGIGQGYLAKKYKESRQQRTRSKTRTRIITLRRCEVD